MDCGATCIRMITKFHGRTISADSARQFTHVTREGSNLLELSDAAERLGFKTTGVQINLSQLNPELPLPCIAHWNQSHFVVLYKVKNDTIYVADPGHGLLKYSMEEFKHRWVSDGMNNGVLLLLEPTAEFFEDWSGEPSRSIYKEGVLTLLLNYFGRYKSLVLQLFIGLFAGSLLLLVMPFLTQSIVDVGIQNHDLSFIYLVLFAQLMVFLGRTSIEILRSWVLLHISSRINISLISDFFIKLMKLPISFFDSKMTGDIMQRINDHYRVESFLTGSSLSILFSMLNFIIFNAVLAWYSPSIFVISLLGSTLYVAWILIFLKHRGNLDFKLFNQNSQNQSKVIELINGMQEIKLHNAERQKRWQWESLQVKLYKIKMQGLQLTQWQNTGSSIINELKNIFITFLTAKLVVDGQITLGMMLAVSYIAGQLNGPIMELLGFIQNWQDAKLSLQRLGDIHAKEEEQPKNIEYIYDIKGETSLFLSSVSFSYSKADPVLNELTLTIPANKVTAIVGSSGSGKTTLMKLLLKFYEPSSGNVLLNSTDLGRISTKSWRDKCGVVMQEGYIFSDTIANNIALGVEHINKEKLRHATEVANLSDYIDSLPLGYNTKIGAEGRGLSTGQKQRILIARAVYKDPEFLFFDEATSALDANNEKIIMNKLDEFFVNRTVVVIAHRLSTVKNADQIVVLDQGKIVEIGDHESLIKRQQMYFGLVKNQLELGN